MYKIRGADQKEYGPVAVEVLRQWIAQRRVDARTPVQAVESQEWKPAAEYPELKDALASSGTAAPAAGLAPPAASPPQKINGLAVASLVLGILGFCSAGITGLVGLPLGIAALVKIGRNPGLRGGKGLAIAGIVTSGFVLVLIPFFLGLMLPALAKAKQKAQTVQCVNNLKQISLGVRLYANDNNDQYPPGATWCDAIMSHVVNPAVFVCRDNPGQRSAFAFNQRLVGKKETDVNPSTVMVFEFNGGWNMTGGPELLPNGPRHGRGINIAFADGSVREVPMSEIGSLRWDP